MYIDSGIVFCPKGWVGQDGIQTIVGGAILFLSWKDLTKNLASRSIRHNSVAWPSNLLMAWEVVAVLVIPCSVWRKMLPQTARKTIMFSDDDEETFVAEILSSKNCTTKWADFIAQTNESTINHVVKREERGNGTEHSFRNAILSSWFILMLYLVVLWRGVQLVLTSKE
jgi:hypothetical protein